MKKLLAIIISMMIMITGVIGHCEEVATIYIPAYLGELMTDEGQENLLSLQNEDGFVDYTVEEDGSMTLVMEVSARDAELKNSKAELDNTITGLLDGDEEVASYVRIEYNKDVSVIDVYVDMALYTEWDSFSAINLALQGYFYQLLAGVKHEEMTGVVNIVNESTGEILNSVMYNEMAESLLTPENLIESDADESAIEETVAVSASTAIPEEVVEIPDVCEFAFESVTITDEFSPANTDSGYLSYVSEEGKKFVNISFYYKNLDTKAVMLDEDTFGGILMYMDKYEYDNEWIGIEHSNRTSVSEYYSIDPLCAVYAHLLFKIPDEVAVADGSLVATVTMHGNTYEIVVR